MKKSNLLLLMAFMFAIVLFNACDEDDPVEVIPDAPVVNAHGTTADAGAGETIEITFSVNIPGGYASSSANAQGGSVSVKSAPAAGATSGSVVVDFTAGSTGGAVFKKGSLFMNCLCNCPEFVL